MIAALVGHTGFVGGSLAAASNFDVLINRDSLESLRGMHIDRLVCAGLPAGKWIANQSPREDAANVRRLETILSTIRAETFVLISTIDVYAKTKGADEESDCASETNHAYGTHRLEFERFVRGTFPRAHIVRLPALFGPGMKKNILYDLLHRHRLERINPASQFQWYPLIMLPNHLRIIETHNLRLVNLFTEPLETSAILERLFPDVEVGHCPDPPAYYDLHTQYGALFGDNERYVLSKTEIMTALVDFVRAERHRK